MKAIEVTGMVDDQGNLSLDRPIVEAAHSRVRVIILCSEEPSGEAMDHVPDDNQHLIAQKNRWEDELEKYKQMHEDINSAEDLTDDEAEAYERVMKELIC
jgi:hypothetical protein